MALKIPSSLKATQLKSLAFQCGISTSGTKAILTQRLLDEIVPAGNHASSNAPTRILSIDMGIRNLAYCVLDLPSRPSTSTSATITGWRRMAVSTAPSPDANANANGILPVAKESFSPPTLSAAAYTLLRHTLLPYAPTHILIERQRFRSMGSPHILEWTIRVNMFESMLYAILHTLRAEKAWMGTVIPIAPGKVGPFWTDSLALDAGEEKGKKRNTKIAKLLNKGAKIDLVKTWLTDKEMVELGTPDVEATAKAYLEKWNRLPGRKRKSTLTKTEEVEEMGKLDDLADSLLQGMAWIEWEKNRRQVFDKGVDSFDLTLKSAGQ